MKIRDLNDDCLYYVFDWLSLAEKCGVQRVSRRWQRVTADMLSVQDSLELVMVDDIGYASRACAGISNAYYSVNFKEFFRNAVMNDEMKSVFSKLGGKTMESGKKMEFFVDNIRHLAITDMCCYDEHELSESAFMQLLKIFRNLTSLKLYDVDILYLSSKDASKYAENLQEFFMYSRSFRFNAFEFVENCKQLKILEVLYQLVPTEMDWQRFQSLERIYCKASFEELAKAIQGLPKLSKIKAIIDAFNLPNLDFESIDHFWRLFPVFATRNSLREIDVAFYGVAYDFCKLRLTSNCLEHIESVTLREIDLSTDDMHIIAKQFPTLSNLALLAFSIVYLNEEGEIRYVDNEENNAVVFEFFENVSSLSKLQSLFLEGRLPLKGTGKEFPSELLSGFLDVEKLPQLRRLSCNCFDIDDCFEAFCKLARNNPKHSYAFNEFDSVFYVLKPSDEVKKRKPLNVSIFTQ